MRATCGELVEEQDTVVGERSSMSPEVVGGEQYVGPRSPMAIWTEGRGMRCQHVSNDVQRRLDATRRVLVASGDPPDPDQAGFAGTVYLVQVCKEHDPDPRRSMADAVPSRFRADRRASEAVAEGLEPLPASEHNERRRIRALVVPPPESRTPSTRSSPEPRRVVVGVFSASVRPRHRIGACVHEDIVGARVDVVE
jgi:hypothetical protein